MQGVVRYVCPKNWLAKTVKNRAVSKLNTVRKNHGACKAGPAVHLNSPELRAQPSWIL